MYQPETATFKTKNSIYIADKAGFWEHGPACIAFHWKAMHAGPCLGVTEHGPACIAFHCSHLYTTSDI